MSGSSIAVTSFSAGREFATNTTCKSKQHKPTTIKTNVLQKTQSLLWNQGLVNLDFDDNKTRFKTNDYISSWLGKTISKVAITKTNQTKEKSWRRRPPQREVVFKDPNFKRSLCKVVSALGFSCITFFTYTPKSSKSYFVLNILRIEWFHVFQLKLYVKCVSNLF